MVYVLLASSYVHMRNNNLKDPKQKKFKFILFFIKKHRRDVHAAADGR
jgi:hypothetical protein